MPASCAKATPEPRSFLLGWVQGRRDLGGRIFIDLRDRSGISQVVFGPDIGKDAHLEADALRSEFASASSAPSSFAAIQAAANLNLPTGEIGRVFGPGYIFRAPTPPPFQIEDDVETREEIRLKYRYLDLRRPKLQKTSSFAAAVPRHPRLLPQQRLLGIRDAVYGQVHAGGARNFLVPSRLNAGKFYALAESPQIFKQLFMVAGMDRYFQIVRCFRDEDLRQDRQPEFTQIDVEMSFVTEEHPDDDGRARRQDLARNARRRDPASVFAHAPTKRRWRCTVNNKAGPAGNRCGCTTSPIWSKPTTAAAFRCSRARSMAAAL